MLLSRFAVSFVGLVREAERNAAFGSRHYPGGCQDPVYAAGTVFLFPHRRSQFSCNYCSRVKTRCYEEGLCRLSRRTGLESVVQLLKLLLCCHGTHRLCRIPSGVPPVTFQFLASLQTTINFYHHFLRLGAVLTILYDRQEASARGTPGLVSFVECSLNQL